MIKYLGIITVSIMLCASMSYAGGDPVEFNNANNPGGSLIFRPSTSTVLFDVVAGTADSFTLVSYSDKNDDDDGYGMAYGVSSGSTGVYQYMCNSTNASPTSGTISSIFKDKNGSTMP